MIDLKKFKKIASDKHTTTLRHDDGHEFKVVHSVLSPKLKKDINKIPMADGGQVPQPKPPTADNVSNSISQAFNWTQDPKTQPSPQPKPKNYAMGDEVVPGVPNNKQLKLDEAGLPVTPPQKELYYPVDQEPYLREKPQAEAATDYSEGLRAIEQPVQEAAKAQEVANNEPSGLSILSGVPQENPLLTKLNDITRPNPELTSQVQRAAQQNIDQNQQIAQNFQQSKARIDAEHQALVHDIMNNHINMNDYWKNNDKGAAALGAMLGGMGAGLTHMANPVPGMIANSQDNFLKAEQANMDNPKSLLSAVQAQYGDNKDAADVMRIISNEALGAHLQKVMAPLNSATAQAQGAQVQLSLMQNTEALKQQIAMRQALQGSSNNLDPAKKILLMQKSGMMNDKQYEQSNKELGAATEVEALRNNLHNSYDDLNSKLLAGTFSPADRESAINAFAGQLEHRAEGRFNFQEAQQQIKALLPGRLESKETRANKLQRMDALLDGLKSTPTLDGLGIEVPQQGSITVIAPDGRSGKVPRAQLQQAIKAGYKQVQ